MSLVTSWISGSARVDDIKGHPQGEIRGATKLVKRRVGELIRLRQKIKTDEEAALLASLDKAAAELDVGKGDVR